MAESLYEFDDCPLGSLTDLMLNRKPQLQFEVAHILTKAGDPDEVKASLNSREQQTKRPPVKR
jgi:hypothetical protein